VMTMLILFLRQRLSASNAMIQESGLAMKNIVRKRLLSEEDQGHTKYEDVRFLSLALDVIPAAPKHSSRRSLANS
jgi:hypothetical protein